LLALSFRKTLCSKPATTTPTAHIRLTLLQLKVAQKRTMSVRDTAKVADLQPANEDQMGYISSTIHEHAIKDQYQLECPITAKHPSHGVKNSTQLLIKAGTQELHMLS
jgi:hypothetical protein